MITDMIFARIFFNSLHQEKKISTKEKKGKEKSKSIVTVFFFFFFFFFISETFEFHSSEINDTRISRRGIKRDAKTDPERLD